MQYDGKRFFGTRSYPNIEPRETDVIYITNETDYLDSLAYKFYKDSSLWWIIALANNLGNGRLSIESGLQIRIPVEIDRITSGYNDLNR
jgi:hypothetical protein